jgi:GTP cyclohydrolase I
VESEATPTKTLNQKQNRTPQTSSKQRQPSATQLAGTTLGELKRAIDGADEGSMDLEKVARGVSLILEGLGENLHREGLLETPARVARMYGELLYGMNEDPADEISCTFIEGEEELVFVKDISFASICEHHMVPFMGVAHIGYIPAQGKISGLSKLARVVELVSRRLQVQERMTAQIADAIATKLNPHGVIVVLEAEHLCMSIRGIRKPGSKTITTSARGVLQTDPFRRQEALMLLQNRLA